MANTTMANTTMANASNNANNQQDGKVNFYFKLVLIVFLLSFTVLVIALAVKCCVSKKAYV